MKTLFLTLAIIATASIGQAQNLTTPTTTHSFKTSLSKVISDPATDRLQWKVSLATLAVAGSLDADSSIRAHRPNLILDPQYDLHQVRNQAVMFGAITGVEYLVARRWPSSVKVLKWVNFAFAGVTIGRSVGNYRTTPAFVFSPFVGRPDCRTQVCR